MAQIVYEAGKESHLRRASPHSLQHRLKLFGLKKGDAISLYLPVVWQAVAVFLACAHIGAVHSVIFSGLRDRFRNVFPKLYQLAGYKPRTAAKKKNAICIGMGQKVPMRAATDDQLVMFTTGPVRSRRRAHIC
jgi:hypothetical protein